VRASEYCLVVKGLLREIAGTAAAKADSRLAGDPGAGLVVACRQGHRGSAGGECRSRGQKYEILFDII
jgi:hypothetical protein